MSSRRLNAPQSCEELQSQPSLLAVLTYRSKSFETRAKAKTSVSVELAMFPGYHSNPRLCTLLSPSSLQRQSDTTEMSAVAEKATVMRVCKSKRIISAAQWTTPHMCRDDKEQNWCVLCQEDMNSRNMTDSPAVRPQGPSQSVIDTLTQTPACWAQGYHPIL
ncbi:hypothetical protein EYF80_023482 [Liparis tanakae]|uniref:Uncharacterized protein n=1 Tax=Liparis tanakae TaxID=230148 RepID=A0A4Z2HKA5_9TELE|nr:hypothetical protein EYF80_023482 [Liparis tanakae]